MKIALLLAPTLSPFTQRQLQPIIEDKDFEIVLAIIDNKREKNIWQRIQKNWRRGRGGYIFIMAIQTLFSSKKEYIESSLYFNNLQIPVRKVSKPYSDLNMAHIKKYSADILFLFSGFGIVKEPLLSVAPLGIISQHHGDMRKYRGMPPAFWELYNGETEVGITIHQVETELDAGPIFKQTIVPLDPAPAGDPMRYIAAYRRDQLLPRGVELLVETVSEIASGGAVSAPQAVEAARTYPYPDYRAVKALRRRVQRRQTQRSAT